MGLDISVSPLARSSREGKGGFFLPRLKISKTSSRHRGCDQGSGVPSTLGLSSSTINSCADFVLLSLGLIAHRPGDRENAWRTDTLLIGAVRARGLLARTEAGDAVTAVQLLGLDSSAPPLVWGIVAAGTPWALQAARSWRSSPSFLRPSAAFFATLEVALAGEALAGSPMPGARAARNAAFFGAPGGV